MAGVDSGLISLLQLIPTLILLIGVFLLADIELSDVVPGANDNASGVATALSLAEELDAEAPENLDVWLLFTGGEECQMEGMRAFFRAHRKSIDRENTYFVVLDAVGSGTVRYETGEGLAVTYDMDKRLVQLCNAVATADRENGDRFAAKPLRQAFATDALPGPHRKVPIHRHHLPRRRLPSPRELPPPGGHPQAHRPQGARSRPRLHPRARARAGPRRRPPFRLLAASA